MILALDVGNTNIHCGLFDGADLRAQWRMSTSASLTSDEFGLLIRQFIAAEGFPAGCAETVAAACVVPPMYSLISKGIRRYLERETFFIDTARHLTLPVLYEYPAEVGADRLANAVAALELSKPPLIVVDFGTATTFDVISAAGEYLGGAIAPGIEISLAALFSRAARLPRIDLVAPGRAIGRNTAESMQSGIIHGYAGLVDNLNRLIMAELGRDAEIIATGGLAGSIVPYSSTVRRIEPTLTLEGIRLIYQRNS